MNNLDSFVDFLCGKMDIEPADSADTKFSIRLSELENLKQHINIHFEVKEREYKERLKVWRMKLKKIDCNRPCPNSPIPSGYEDWNHYYEVNPRGLRTPE